MYQGDRLYIAQGENPCYLLLNQANRHGLIAGASGTGKTVTLKQLAQGFSQAGVPVFLADAKGDVTGMLEPGAMNKHLRAAMDAAGITEWEFKGCPCRFWNIIGGEGIPVRVTISDMGPVLLSRLLGLTEVQEGVLNIVFRIADDKGLLLIDLKDLRAMLNYVANNASEFQTTYGNVSPASVGAILRTLIPLEDQGGNEFFGEPALDIADWFALSPDGQGYVNILDATKLINSPQVYAMFLLWMMSELFETLPEVGDPDKPKFVFFFDEAHLLFNGMPKELLDRIIQVVKLVRSKGVGIYFISQSPSDIPNEVLAQLSNRVQHGLRAYTPAEQKAVKAAAQSFRENPAFDATEAILDLGTGEALVSCLDEDGRPSVVERARIWACECSMSAASEQAKSACLAAADELMDKYGTAIDRQSAFEDILDAQAAANAQAAYEAGLVDAPSDTAAENGDWTCPACGTKAAGKFCPECGGARPAPATAEGPWTCPECGTVGEGKFCMECGAKRPAAAQASGAWFCPECGVKVESGKFCPECGTPRPAGANKAAATSAAASKLNMKADAQTAKAIKEQEAAQKAAEKQAAADAKAQEKAAKEAERAKAKAEAAAAKAKAAEEKEAAKRAKQTEAMVADVIGAVARSAGVSASAVSAGKSVIKNGGILRGLLGSMKK